MMPVNVHPRLRQQFDRPSPASRLGSRWDRVRLPAPGKGKASWPNSASLHPGLLLTHRRFVLVRAGGPVEVLVAQAAGGQPVAEAVLRVLQLPGPCPPGGFPSLCASHTAAGFLFFSLIFHHFSRSLWALLYNDAESQKFRLLPESVWDCLYRLISPNETQPSAVGELLYLFINTNCVFLLAPCRCCRDCWPALVAWHSWQTRLGHKPLPGRCRPPGHGWVSALRWQLAAIS